MGCKVEISRTGEFVNASYEENTKGQEFKLLIVEYSDHIVGSSFVRCLICLLILISMILTPSV